MYIILHLKKLPELSWLDRSPINIQCSVPGKVLYRKNSGGDGVFVNLLKWKFCGDGG